MLSSHAGVAQTQPSFSRTVESSFWEGFDEHGRKIRKEVRGDYTLTFICPEGCYNLLLEERVEHIQEVGMLGQTSTIQVTAWRQEDHGQYQRMWELRDNFDRGEVWSQLYYQTTSIGCCDSEDAYRLFDLLTGEQILQYTGPLFQIDVPNSPINALIAYHSNAAMRAFEGQDRHKGIDGMLTLVTNDRSINQVYFHYPAHISTRTPGIELIPPQQSKGTHERFTRHLDLWHSEGKTTIDALTDFGIRLRFSDGSFMILPVQDGKFDIYNLSGDTTVEVFPKL